MSKQTDRNAELKSILVDDFLGAEEFSRSKIGYLTGVTALAKNARSLALPLGAALSIFRPIKRLFARREPGLIKDISDASERFEAAVDYMGLSAADIEAQKKSSALAALLYLSLSVIALAWGVYLLSSSFYSLWGPLHYLFPFFPIYILAPYFLKYSLAYHRFEKREMTEFRDYLRRPACWFSFLAGLRSVNASLLAAGVAAALLVAVPDTAYAFSLTDTLSEDDMWYRLLQYLVPIGPIEPSADLPPWIEPLKSAFVIFNTSLLTIGSLLLGWHTVLGVVATARDEKVLGERWSGIWGPLRAVTGVATLVPVASGFCAAQVLILQLVVWGGGLANQVWGGYIGYFRNNTFIASEQMASESERRKLALASLASDTDSRTRIMEMLEKLVCIASVQTIYKQALSDYALSQPAGTPAPTLEDLRNNSVSPDVLKGFYAKLGDARWFSAFRANANGSTPLNTVINGYAEPFLQKSMLYDVAHFRGYPDANHDFVTEGSGDNRLGAWHNSEVKYPFAVWDYGPVCGRITFSLYDHSPVIAEYVDNAVAKDAEGKREYVSTWDQLKKVDVVPASETEKAKQHLHKLTEMFAYGSRGGANEFTGFGEVQRLLSIVAAQIVAAAQHQDAAPAILEGGSAQTSLLAAQMEYENLIRRISASHREVVGGWADKASQDALLDEIAKQGWASAGTFYITLARLQRLSGKMVDVAPKVEDTDWSSLQQLHSNYYATVFGNHSISHVFSAFKENALRSTGNAVVDQFMSDMQKPSGAGDSLNGVLEHFGWDFATIIGWFSPDPFNAMLHIIDFGHTIIWYTLVVFGIVLLVGTALGLGLSVLTSGAVGGGAGAIAGAVISNALSGIVASAGGIIKLVLLVIMAMGTIHAYVIPMLPYIMMLFVVMGMLVLVAEAMVAAPIWALFHVRLDGQEFVDQVQRPGYMIAFNLILRPVLAIFGLLLSYAVFGAIIWFVNSTFVTAGKSLVFGSGDLVGVVVMLGLLTYIHYQIAIRSFTLINQVPDRVARWFGQGGEQLGEQSDAEATTNMIMGGVSRRVEMGTQFSAGTMMGKGGRAGSVGKAVGPEKGESSVGSASKPEPGSTGSSQSSTGPSKAEAGPSTPPPQRGT